MSKMTDDKISNIIIGCAIEVHKALGPGLLESAYEKCLKFELENKNLNVKNQLSIPIKYKNIFVDCAYRIDLLVEDRVIVELKTVEKILPIHLSQLLTYLRFKELRLGLIINFNVRLVKDGIERLIL